MTGNENTTTTQITNDVAIAMVCHEANKKWCELTGDYSQKSWADAEQWQRDSAIKGVNFCFQNPKAAASSHHDAWMSDKIADGWVYGEIKDTENKTHPCLVPYDQLPLAQQQKDKLFQAIVDALN
jgi:hypothetical protein